MVNEIILKDMKFHAYHGVLEQEKIVGGEFTVSLRVAVDFSKAMVSDDVGDTVDYGKVYEVVRREMGVRSRLLEHVAGRIVRAIEREFEGVVVMEVEVFKEVAPVRGEVRCGVRVRKGER